MEGAITFDDLIKVVTTIGIIWGAVKVAMEIIKAITARHDREQKWDEAADRIKEERDKIVERYDDRLKDLEDKIDSNYTDTEAKMQEIRTELLILTECMRAVLDGLHQQGCNGEVTKAKAKLDSYLIGLVGK